MARRVAISLNRLLFDSPRANDALLFMTILSTDLKALKRRGYNGKVAVPTCHTPSTDVYLAVDRILRQQKAERQAVEKDRLENASLLSKPPLSATSTASAPLTPLTPDSVLPSTPPSAQTPSTPLKPPSPPPLPSKPPLPIIEPPPTSRNPFKIFQRKIEPSTSGELAPLIPPFSHKSPIRPDTDGHVTPLSNISKRKRKVESTLPTLPSIESNIDMAIKACRPESGNLLRNRQEMRQVKESLDEGYCDISGRVGDLNRVGE
ncbi:hypothetical protein DXG03_003891 [Asterophora parasitica]|uniref:Uncharacterized protein n=1 Tax=Asterophora parasitica TaxID=117018 RepID=A0A9P7GB53_9AGAR|nr:hypothetical protein DXG03_003891 [Asterophora parasitica]